MLDKYIKPLDKEKKGGINDTVMALSGKSESSHDPVFIFDGDMFLGLVWPYQMLYSSRQDRGMLASSILVKPPIITTRSDIYEVVSQMLSLRSYVLPVFDRENKITGVIQAKNILVDFAKRGKKDVFFGHVEVDGVLKVKMEDTLRIVLPVMRIKKATRVVVVDEKGKVRGVVSRRDIYRSITRPTAKQRYANKGGGQKQLLFDQEWDQKLDYPMANLIRRRRVEYSQSAHPRVWLRQLLDKNAGSIVVVDSITKPKGIVSTRTFLKAIVATKPKIKPMVEISDTSRLLSRFQIEAIRGLLEKFMDKVAKRFDQVRLAAAIKALKNSAGKVTRYELRLELKRVGKKVSRSLVKGRRVWDVVREGLAEIKKQIRRD